MNPFPPEEEPLIIPFPGQLVNAFESKVSMSNLNVRALGLYSVLKSEYQF
jgi:hypothetical protein